MKKAAGSCQLVQDIDSLYSGQGGSGCSLPSFIPKTQLSRAVSERPAPPEAANALQKGTNRKKNKPHCMNKDLPKNLKLGNRKLLLTTSGTVGTNTKSEECEPHLTGRSFLPTVEGTRTRSRPPGRRRFHPEHMDWTRTRPRLRNTQCNFSV